ncbi:Dephospho-CoA kinase [hydrothermal vent metagenome]|uniref:Dephospho-CoA kinase n=1 Tax=hydrothermal vent metagenome TaxID=652676 RepID=A0A3B0YXQ8_9ZZZZ
MSCRLRIGLTGGIGSGKSEVSRLFAEHGTVVIDTDVISRELVEPGQPALNEIVTVFSTDILDAEGRLGRNRLRKQIFSDPGKRDQLEAILHPRIHDRAFELADAANTPYCLLVIPLLVETRSEYALDRILVVDAPTEKQFERIATRDHLPHREIKAILDSQAGREQRLAIADDVILNDGGLDHLKAEVTRLDRQYRQLADTRPR